MLKKIVYLALSATMIFAAGNSNEDQGKYRLLGFEKLKQIQQQSQFSNLSWMFLGPTNISGRCTDVEVVRPKGKNYTIYVATASGGIWKTENEGTTWEPIFENQPTASIGDIAIDPKNPQIIWAGTGEANIFRSSQAGCGIFRSADGGKTWQHLGLEETLTIARIVIHPQNSDIVYVAASGHEWTPNRERGVYKTTDSGKTWQKILYIDELTGAIDLLIDPRNPEVLYAATWQRIRKKWNDPRTEPHYSGSGIFKTTDGGKTWRPIIDLCLQKPDTLYAFIDNYEISRLPTEEEKNDPYGIPSCGFIKGATLFRSDNGGEEWRQVSPQNEETKKYLERFAGTYGWVFGQVRVDPVDENRVYLLGVPLAVTEDGGKSFRTLRGMHADHHGLWIDPENPDYLVNVNDGGIVISYDRGKNWKQFTHNLPVCQFFNLNYDMSKPFNVYGSMQDHGSFRAPVVYDRKKKLLKTQQFLWAPGGEGSNHFIDPLESHIVYSAGFYGLMMRTDMRRWPERSATKIIKPQTFPEEPPLRGQWLTPFIVSPHNNETIYVGYQYLFKSINRGDSWQKISPDLTFNDPKKIGDIKYQTIFTISESPLKQGLIYVGTDDGRAHITKDDGKTWKEISAGLKPGRWISRVVASQHKLATVYLTQNGKRDDDFRPYVFKSDNYGQSWQDISAGLPLGPVNVIREDPFNKDILYLGTDNTVFVSLDGGKNWQVLGNNLLNVYVHDLIIHPRENLIVIATHGRGMWVIDARPVNRQEHQLTDDDEY